MRRRKGTFGDGDVRFVWMMTMMMTAYMYEWNSSLVDAFHPSSVSFFHHHHFVKRQEDRTPIQKKSSLCFHTQQRQRVRLVLWSTNPPRTKEREPNNTSTSNRTRNIWKQSITTVTGKWRENFLQCQKHYKKTGHLQKISNPKLTSWLIYQRKLYEDDKLHCDRIDALESIGMKWKRSPHKTKTRTSKPKTEDPWQEQYLELTQFYNQHGHTRIPFSEPHVKLAQWCHSQKLAFQAGTLPLEKYQALSSVGMLFLERRKVYMWKSHVEALTLFVQAYGHAMVPQRYVHHPTLGQWVNQLRHNQGKHLTMEQRQQLDALHFEWKSVPQQTWLQSYQQVKHHILQKQNNTKTNNTVSLSATEIIQDYKFFPTHLRSWIRVQQRAYPRWKNHTLTTTTTAASNSPNTKNNKKKSNIWLQRKELLESIHFESWSQRIMETSQMESSSSSIDNNDWNALFEEMRQRGINANAPLAILPQKNTQEQENRVFENLSEQDLIDLWNQGDDEDDDDFF